LSSSIPFDKANREQNSLVVDAEVKAIMSENANEEDVVISTVGSIIINQRSAWAFSARSGGRSVQEASSAFAMITSSMKMLPVTKVLVRIT
jgi:hypothetical protein